jgi:hypothetical protein
VYATISAITAGAAPAHASTATFATSPIAEPIHIATNAETSSTGSQPTQGRAARSSLDGRRIVAATPLCHRSRPFHFETIAHVS